jgi:hypothetical protein
MVGSRSHFANKYLNLFNNGSPPLGTIEIKHLAAWSLRRLFDVSALTLSIIPGNAMHDHEIGAF